MHGTELLGSGAMAEQQEGGAPGSESDPTGTRAHLVDDCVEAEVGAHAVSAAEAWIAWGIELLVRKARRLGHVVALADEGVVDAPLCTRLTMVPFGRCFGWLAGSRSSFHLQVARASAHSGRRHASLTWKSIGSDSVHDAGSSQASGGLAGTGTAPS